MNIFKHGENEALNSKVNRWHVKGYAGWHDYDGPQDDNVDYILYLGELPRP